MTNSQTSLSSKSPYAGLGERLGAGILDTAICAFALALLSVIVTDLVTQMIVYQTLCLAYYIALETGPRGATLGKMALGLRVGTPDGGAMPVPLALLRYAVWAAPWAPCLLYMVGADFLSLIEHTKVLESLKGDEAAAEAYIRKIMESDAADMVANTILSFFALAALGVLAGIFLYVLPIGITREKTGLHDLLSKTRVFKIEKGSV